MGCLPKESRGLIKKKSIKRGASFGEDVKRFIGKKATSREAEGVSSI